MENNKYGKIGSIMPTTLEELRGEYKVLAKWYKTLGITHELVIHKGGTSKLVIPVKNYPSDSDVASALRITGGYSAEVVTTSVERRPYNLIDETEREEYYGYHEEMKDSPFHLFESDEIRKAVRERIKEDSE